MVSFVNDLDVKEMFPLNTFCFAVYENSLGVFVAEKHCSIV